MANVAAWITVLSVSIGCNAGSIHRDGPSYEAPLPVTRDSGAAESDDLAGAQPVFRPHIQRDIENTGCSGCHGRGTYPFIVMDSPISDTEWRANYEEVIRHLGDGTSAPIVELPLGAEGHPVILRPDSDVPARWREWIRNGAPYQQGDVGVRVTPDGGSGETEDPITWAAVQGVFASNDCMRCHGTEGGYSLESMEAATGPGSDDVPNVIPGDASSLLVSYCRDGHQGIGYRDALTVLAWVVEWGARVE